MRVMHIVDSLSTGGAERMAVTFVNNLYKNGIDAYLCVTRQEGNLKDDIINRTNYIFLGREKTFDFSALLRLMKFIRKHKILLIHAHGSSFFIAVFAKVLKPSIKLVWHDHHGFRPKAGFFRNFPIQIFSIFFSRVFSVNNNLKIWAVKNLLIHNSKVLLLPNCADVAQDELIPWRPEKLNNKIILCLANLRWQKDQLSLISAFKKVKDKHSEASLYLVGKDSNDEFSASLKNLVNQLSLTDVFFAGEQQKVVQFLNKASVGILSSCVEGLPVALLEYGVAGLPVVCTNVGECGTIIEDRYSGLLTPPRNPNALAKAIITLFENEDLAKQFSRNFAYKIKNEYSIEISIQKVKDVYNSLLSSS